MTGRRLGVGFIGSGFITRFHIRSWQAVRDADVRGVWSPNREPRRGGGGAGARAAASATHRPTPPSRRWSRIRHIDCIWICGPNFARVENMERIVAALSRGALAGRRRLREAARPQRRRSQPDGRARRTAPACCTAISRTSCSRRPSSAARRSSGRAARRWPDGRTSRARPRSTAARTCRGSGAAICRAAAC